MESARSPTFRRRIDLVAVDLAVLTQSPRIRGGLRTQVEAFWAGAERQGHRPHLFYIGYSARSVSFVRRTACVNAQVEKHPPLVGTAYPGVLPELEAVAQLAAAPRIAPPLREASAAWVVTTSAHHGWAAARSGRPYACWVGTSWQAENDARRNGLSASRRAALHVNRPVLRRLERQVLRRAELVCATSPYVRELVRREAARDEVGLLPIPVDSRTFAPEPDEEWFGRLETPVVVFVGRASDPRKNIGLLVDAFALLRRRLPRARLRLVGRPPATRPADAEVLGEVPEVAPHLRTASLFVLPSLQEGFGVAAAEALACGVPVIVTPSGGPEHLVRSSGGGVVLDGFDAEELADTAAALLSDPERLGRMRESGREYVAREHGVAVFDERLREAFARLAGRT
jgi:glycosyltransferase involved in cell wall biosynthesis